MYEATIAALRDEHQRLAPHRVIDIGCGDGRITQASLTSSTLQLDLVEPSSELLGRALARLGTGLRVMPHGDPIQDLLPGLVSPSTGWDLAQSTFAIHTVPPRERAEVLRQLAGLISNLVLVEFDVGDVVDSGPDHAAYVAERYERGLAEYADDQLVVQGFLMPVLVGQFDPAQPRHTWEQPASAWVRDLEFAGFTNMESTVLHDYWWATAHLITATGNRPRS